MKKKERVLTPQEEKRKQNYDGICQQLQEKGYERTDLIVDGKFVLPGLEELNLPLEQL